MEENRLFGIEVIFTISAVVFVICTILHLLTYLSFSMNNIISLGIHFVILLIYLVLVKVSGSMIGLRFKIDKDNLNYANKFFVLMHKIASIYCLINFGLCLYLSDMGIPDIWSNQYVLQNKGVFIRELSFSEYKRLMSYESRLISAFWLMILSYIISLCSGLLNKNIENP